MEIYSFTFCQDDWQLRSLLESINSKKAREQWQDLSDP